MTPGYPLEEELSTQNSASTEQQVVLIMRPNPKPLRTPIFYQGESSVVTPDSRGPIHTHLLEVNGWVKRISQSKAKVLEG